MLNVPWHNRTHKLISWQSSWFVFWVTRDTRRVFLNNCGSLKLMGGVCAASWVNKCTFKRWNFGAGGNRCGGSGWISKDRICRGSGSFSSEQAALKWLENWRSAGMDAQPSALSWLHPVAFPCQWHTHSKEFWMNLDLGFGASAGFAGGFCKGWGVAHMHCDFLLPSQSGAVLFGIIHPYLFVVQCHVPRKWIFRGVGTWIQISSPLARISCWHDTFYLFSFDFQT